MGYALAKMAVLRGAEVTLVSGPVSLQPFAGVNKIDVVSAQDMFEAVTSRSAEQDAIIMCSAVADYKPAACADQKVKKSDAELNIALTRTQDILGYLGAHKREGQVLVGFSMETEHLIENSREKLTKKNADLICANSITSAQTGFAVDTNQVTLITQQEVKPLPLCSKEETADLILDQLLTFHI
jgi:phosphopantothenoylcysteine decarboxylase/phosphopantothenate--cysteine ligase